MFNYARPFADRAGVDLGALTMVEANLMTDEKLRAMKLPKSLRDRVNTLMALREMIAIKGKFPSDLMALIDKKGSCLSHDQLVQAFKNNIRYWGLANGLPFEEPLDDI